jgi:N-acetylneuraminic acid mutarotase
VAVDAKIYVIGGRHTEEGNVYATNSVHIYDTATDTWSTGTPMPEAREGHACAAFDGKIYVIGGWVTSATDWESNVWVYDPSGDSWNDLSPAYQTFSHQTSVVWGDYIFMFPYTNDGTWAYEVPANAWWVGADATTRYNGHAAAVVGDIMYLAGGSFRAWSAWTGYYTDYTGSLLAYDPTLPNTDPNAWVRKAGMPTERDHLALAVANGKLFAIGGYNSDGPQRAVEMYDPLTDSWSEKFPLMTGTRDHSAVTVDGQIYVIGGRGYYDSVGSVYVYDPANEW